MITLSSNKRPAFKHHSRYGRLAVEVSQQVKPAIPGEIWTIKGQGAAYSYSLEHDALDTIYECASWIHPIPQASHVPFAELSQPVEMDYESIPLVVWIIWMMGFCAAVIMLTFAATGL